MTNSADLELDELIESCWVALRAEEIADEKFNSETESDEHWQAFEAAHTDAGFEWVHLYAGRTYGEVDADEMLDKAIELAKSQRDWEGEQVQFFSVNKVDDDKEVEDDKESAAAWDPNAEETVEDAIRAEAIRRAKVRRLIKKK